MAKSVGSIEIILGKGTLINVKGQEKKLINNLKLFEDDVLATGDDTTLLIKLRNGHTISLGSNRVLTLDESVMNEESFATDETQAEIAKIQEILAESKDMEELDETAAGDDSSSQSSSVVGSQSAESHHQNTGHTESSILDAFSSTISSNKNELDTNDSFIVPLDTESATIGISSILTNDTTPFISGTTNDPTADILITIGGNNYTADNHGDGTWSLTVDTPLNEGNNTIAVIATDPSGNTTEVTSTITIDTVLDDANGSNAGNVVTIDTITQDTGSSDNDFITNDTTLIIAGTFDNEDGNTLRVNVNGTEYTADINSNNWVLNLENITLNDGEHNVVATVTDLAGNEVSTTQTITIDTNSNDTGSGENTTDGNDATITLNTISGDNVINKVESENVTITGSTTAINGSTVTLYIGNSVLAEVSVANGIFSYDVPSNMFNLYNDGIYEVRAEVLADAAGNVARDSQTVTLDTHLDNGSGGGLDNQALITIDSITDDTGISNSDFITSDTSLSVNGTYDSSNGKTLEVDIGGITYTPTTNGNNWEITLPTLNDGDTTLEITISDTAGNTQTITQTITVDTTADIDDGTGTGNTVAATITLDTVSGDNFLNANEAGNLLTLSGNSNVIGATVAITINGNPFTSTIVNPDGSYSVDVDTTIIATFPDGEYKVEATIITDDAGNSIYASHDVVLDTTLDSGTDTVLDTDNDGDIDGNDDSSINVTIDSISDDSGLTDFITSDKTLIINGQYNADTGNTLVVKVDNKIYTSADTELTLDSVNNKWTLDLQSQILADGQYSISAIIKDSAGNSETAQQNIQIVDSTDIGIINLHEISDNFINAQEATEPLLITGTSTQLGQTVNFTLNSNPLIINGITITAIVAADGTFSIEIPADTFTVYADGEYSVGVSVVALNDGITYTDSENVFLDRTNTGNDGNGTGTDGSDATIMLSTIGDGFINAQEAETGLLVTGITTAVEGTAISFIFETSTGDKYPVTQNSNGQPITANQDGTFSAFIALGDLTGVDNSDIIITAQVVADKAGNIASSNTQNITVDLSAGTLTTHDSTTPVYESSLDNGSAPSFTDRSTTGSIFENDNIGNSTLTSFSANGEEATVWSENSSILTLTTNSGSMFIATTDTAVNGVAYSAGDYLYILENSSSTTVDTFTYSISDTAGNTASADLNIAIVDDVATINEDGAVHKYLSADTSGYATNLILTLDVSGSMLFDADGSAPGDYHYEYGGFLGLQRTKVSDYDESTIRIDLAKDALKNLIDKYAELGDVNVQIISFNDTATASAMLDGIAAKNYIDGLTADGGTNYQAALDTAQANPVDSYPDANTTQYYFISDGQPNNNITQAEYTQWQTYIKDSPIDKTYAIGVGGQVDTQQLNNVSGNMSTGADVVNEISGIDGDTIVISSITDLDNTLIQTVNSAIITGSLTSFDVDGVAISMGADGGHITQISIFDQIGNLSETISYDVNQTSKTITTPLGGILNIDFEDGSYSYAVDYKDSIAGKQEKIDVTVVDSDGESVTNSIIIHLENSENENYAYDTNAIDGGVGFDSLILSGAQSLDFDNISNIQNIEAIDMSRGDNEILNLDINDVISMTDSDNELFIYGEAQDSVTLDTTLVDQGTTTTDSNGKVFDVYSDADATVTVNIEQEIVVS